MTTFVIHYRAGRFTGLHAETGTEDSIVQMIAGDHVPGVIDLIESYDAAEGWSRFVTEDIARAVARHCEAEGEPILQATYDFIETHGGPGMARGLRVWDRTFSAA